MAHRKRTSRRPRTRSPQSARRRESQKVEEALRKFKRGTLHAGRSHAKVRNRKQALAIGLAEARRSGARAASARKKGARHTRRNRKR
jgi:hypothetical protein